MADDPSGGLVMESFASLMQGGEHGPVITPGVPISSRLFLMAAGKMEPIMPPDDMEGLKANELEILQRWIEEGAMGPADGAMPTRTLKTPSIPANVRLPRPVTALALSPDGSLLAVGGFGEVELVDAKSMAVQQTFSDLPGKVNDVRFSGDGTQLVVGSGITGLQGTIQRLDVASGKTLQLIHGHRDTLYCVAISPDGNVIASGGYDRVVHLWDAHSGELLRTMKGHNGAIFDLAFSSNGQVIATASADETVKLWRVADGVRLDTLSQPQGEVWCVAFSPDDRQIVAGSADNRFRVWNFESKTEPRLNTLVETRFADESPLVRLTFTPDGKRLLVASEAGRMGVFETVSWNKVAVLPDADEVITELVVSTTGDQVYFSTMRGDVRKYALPVGKEDSGPVVAVSDEVFLQVDAIADVQEIQQPHGSAATAMTLPRGAKANGVISEAAEQDWYRFDARAGEVWMIETEAARSGSPLDSLIEVCDADGNPVVRARLQAVRDSYFTFRGKNSDQSNDFRLFAWEEMELNDMLYSSGEVTRLWMYPRGPDSGFNVYPGTGKRHTFFDTTSVTHALQEPAYVVRELKTGEEPVSNGLPVFTVYYANDDDSTQQLGTDSRIRFTAPQTASYTVRVTDARGMAGEAYKYGLTLRPAAPDFKPALSKISKPIPAGAGREFRVSVNRIDGFMGPVTFEISGMPEGLHATPLVTVEANQQEAYGVVWADDAIAADQSFAEPTVVARANILGRTVEHQVGGLGALKSSAAPQVKLKIAGETERGGETVVRIRPGETISTLVRVERNGLDGEIKLGNEFAGRNMPHGVFVDNIGLSGLMVLKGADEQPFFITAAPIAATGERYFHLKAEIDGGITSPPVLLITE